MQVDRLQSLIEMGIDILNQLVEPCPVSCFNQFADPVRQARRMTQLLLPVASHH